MKRQTEFEPRMDGSPTHLPPLIPSASSTDGRGWVRVDRWAECVALLRFEFCTHSTRDQIFS